MVRMKVIVINIFLCLNFILLMLDDRKKGDLCWWKVKNYSEENGVFFWEERFIVCIMCGFLVWKYLFCICNNNYGGKE